MRPRERAPGCIAVPHHALFPAYVTALRGLGRTDGGGVPIPAWDAQTDRARMGRQRQSAAVRSASAAGVNFDDIGLARRLARQCKEALARTVHAFPARFSALAVMPLPDVDAACPNSLTRARRCVGPPRAGDFGLVTSGDTTGARKPPATTERDESFPAR